MPMRRLPLPTETYQSTSTPLVSTLLQNLYAEKQPSDARSPVALMPRPGLSPYYVIGSGPILAMVYSQTGFVYSVSGTHAYRTSQTSPGSYTNVDLGSVGTSNSFPPTISFGNPRTVVCVPPNAYWCDDTTTLTQITDSNFLGANSVCAFDSYFVFTGTGSGGELKTEWFISPLNAPQGPYNAFAFNTAQYTGGIQQIVPLLGNLWIFGFAGIEVWYDAGASDFPFRRQAILQQGCWTPNSIATGLYVGNNCVVWLGSDLIVYQSNGYTAQRISTHPIEAAIIAAAGVVSDATIYSHGGHIFYQMTLAANSTVAGSQNLTLVYDFATQLWHTRQGPNGYRFGGAFAINVGSVVLISDPLTNAVYSMIDGQTNDNGVAITSQIVMPPLYASTNRAFMNRVEVDVETGETNDPTSISPILLEWSNDGGVNYVGSRSLVPMGGIDTRRRFYATRLGSFRERTLRITAQGHVVIYDVFADMEEGDA